MCSKIDVCIYHKPCFDGGLCAYLVHKYNDGHPCEFYGCRPGGDKYTFPDIDGMNVLIADISFSRNTMIELHSRAKSLVCLDHHKTAKEALEGLDFCMFDMSRAGCQMTWDYLIGGPRPRYVDYTGGRDIWDFSLSGTKEFTSMMFHEYCGKSKEEMFDVYDTFADEKVVDSMIEDGKHLLKFDATMVEKMSKNGVKCQMGDHIVYAVEGGLYRSEVGQELAKKASDNGETEAIGLTYTYNIMGDEWWISMRTFECQTDVAAVAQKYENGGGHAAAAGFTWKGLLPELLQVL